MKFVGALNNFLGKNSESYKQIVGEILSTFESLRCNLCVNIHFFFYRKNLLVSDENDELFHFNIKWNTFFDAFMSK